MITPSDCPFDVYSEALNDTISIEIALPEGYSDFPEEQYTSIYLLDANYFFDEAPGTLDEYLTRGQGMTNTVQCLTDSGIVPASILIGIDYTEEQRTRFTVEDVADFYRFFTDELIPVIESKYRVSKSSDDRVLFGYSSSAHFSTYALMNDVFTGVETFSKFISVSGVYTDSLEACKLEEQIFQSGNADAFSGRSLFIAVGADDSNLELLNNHRLFSERLVNRGYTNFRTGSTEYPDRGHYDIPEFAFSEGLIFLFSR